MMNLIKIICERYSFYTLLFFGCFCITFALNLSSDFCTNEPIVKCAIFSLALGLIFAGKLVTALHFVSLLGTICFKDIPKYCQLPTYKEMKVISALIAFSIMLLYMLSVYYREDFDSECVYVATKYLIVAMSIMLHNKLKQKVVI
jgi:hypothetical protein